jgi:tetratricopeptide (TPR) repeat protein/TolB-like protein
VLGTLGYMSPEQVRGREADHRSDVFSLGCVLYEMAGGRRAFEGDSGADTMAAILTGEPEKLSSSGVEIPLDLELAIQRCLEKAPDDRFQSAADLAFVLRASATDTDAVRAVQSVPLKKTHSKWLFPAAAAAVLTVIAIALWVVLGERLIPAPESDSNFEATRVVVAKFEDRIGDPSFDDFGIHVSDSITALLRQVGGLKVATNPFRSGAQGAARQGEPADGDPLRRLAEATRSGLVVTGACYSRGDQVEIQARIVDPWRDEVRQSFDAVQAPRSYPSSAVDELCQQVAGTLALHFDNLIPLGLSRPIPLAAVQEYAGALEQWGIDNATTVSRLERALEVDPTFHLARSILFWGYITSGLGQEAEAELAVLESHQPTMTPFDRCGVRAARARFDGLPLDVLSALRETVSLAPNAYLALSQLGSVAKDANRPREAVEALSRIPYDWTSGSASLASRPFAHLGLAYHMLGDYEAQRRVAAESLEHFPDAMVFYGLQTDALAAMGRFEELTRLVNQSLTIPARRSTAGDSHAFTARELRAHGYREQSLEIAGLVVDWYRERPEQIRRYPWRFVPALNVAERWHEALEITERLAQERPGYVHNLGLLGVLEARVGNTDEASRIAKELLTSDDEHSLAERSYWRACIAAQLGQLDEAVRLLRRAFSEGHPFSDEFHRDINLEPLWGHPPFQELIRPKG